MLNVEEGAEESAPGTRHFASDMSLATLMVTMERSVASATLGPGMSTSQDSVSLAMLLTLVDITASSPMLALTKGWTATQDLSISLCATPTVGPIVADNRVLRVGKKSVIMSSELYDAGGLSDLHEIARVLDAEGMPDGFVACGRALTNFARIPRAAAQGVDEYDPETWIGVVQGPIETGVAPGFPAELMGLVSVAPEEGIFELGLSPYVANSIGTINGGAQALMIETAAEAMCPGLHVNDLLVRYLSQLRGGPARSRGRILRIDAHGAVVEIMLLDAGNEDKVLTVATAMLGPR